MIYELYLLFTIVVPGSAIPTLKLGFVVCFVAFGIVTLFKRGILVSPKIFVAAIVTILLFAMLGVINNNDNESILIESLTYTIFACTLYFMLNGYSVSKNKNNYILIGFSIYIVMKLGVFISASSFSFIISSVAVYHTIKEYVPAAVVSSFAAGGTPRIVFSNDFNLPIFIFWLSCVYSFRLIRMQTFFVLSFLTLIVIVLSLSRYLYVFTAVILFFSALIHLKPKTVFIYAFGGLVFVVMVPIVINYIGYTDLIEDRLIGTVASNSNLIKLEQLVILEDFYRSFSIGQGLGLDLDLAGRDLRNRFQSEVQWLGLLAKTGFVGLMLLFTLLFVIIRQLLTSRYASKNYKINLYIIPVLVVWLLAGLTNPVLFLTTTSINLLLLYSVYVENRRVRALR